MRITKKEVVLKIHLIISVFIVGAVAFVYGFEPQSQFEIHLKTIDEHNFFKAIMGLYLGFSILWILGILKNSYLKTALITNIIFMLGLTFGRVLSLLLDGIPTFGFLFGTFAELFLGCYGLWVLSKKLPQIESNS
jgi:hypothetical protein